MQTSWTALMQNVSLSVLSAELWEAEDEAREKHSSGAHTNMRPPGFLPTYMTFNYFSAFSWEFSLHPASLPFSKPLLSTFYIWFSTHFFLALPTNMSQTRPQNKVPRLKFLTSPLLLHNCDISFNKLRKKGAREVRTLLQLLLWCMHSKYFSFPKIYSHGGGGIKNSFETLRFFFFCKV